jgi:hypothetical protein
MRNVLTSLVAVTAVVTVASAARAGIMHYADQTSGTLSVTHITETNDTPADWYYGAPILNGTQLNFPITGTLPFKADASGPNGSDILDVKLSFDVTSQGALPVAAFLSEVGDYVASGTAGSAGGDTASILIFGPNNSLLASATGAYNAPPGTTAAIWQNNFPVIGSGTATTFHVVIDNVLHSAAVGPLDFALIEKKAVSINLGSGSGAPPSPEPASLGVLALGGMALLTRRRKA